MTPADRPVQFDAGLEAGIQLRQSQTLRPFSVLIGILEQLGAAQQLHAKAMRVGQITPTIGHMTRRISRNSSTVFVLLSWQASTASLSAPSVHLQEFCCSNYARGCKDCGSKNSLTTFHLALFQVGSPVSPASPHPHPHPYPQIVTPTHYDCQDRLLVVPCL